MHARIWSLLLSLGLAATTSATAREQPKKSYFQVDIHHVGIKELNEVKARPEISWWIEADDVLFVLADHTFTLPRRPVRRLAITPATDRLFFVQKGHARDLDALDGEVLSKAGRMALIQARDARPATGVVGEMMILPFQPNTVFAKQADNAPEISTTRFDPDIQTMLAALDGDRWFKDVSDLASFNRYSYDAAFVKVRDWLMARFSENPGVTVESQEYKKNALGSWNVVATIKGSTRPEDVYIFGAHYDSTSEAPRTSAPGAEDNASGTAGLLELARIFSVHKPKATVVFVAFSGEEQGLWGSQAYVRRLIEEGKRDTIKAVITMDMIGFDGNNTIDCLIEASAKDKPLVETLRAAAATYTHLELKTSEHYWGSDHVSFIQEGIPALLTIEDDWDDYPDYHRTSDEIGNINVKMGMEVLKMNLAAVATMANEP